MKPRSGSTAQAWDALQREIVGCVRCPRLVAYRTEVARTRRAAFRDQRYWGRPLPGWGDAGARLVIVGLAPAAHGGNRTGRIFTGDRSGDWLFRALHRAGFANQPNSVSREDGLALRDCYITAAVRCAPPENRPTPAEFDRCRPYLEREFRLLWSARVVVVLGRSAHEAFLRTWRSLGHPLPSPKSEFRHGKAVDLGLVTLVMSYHPSQRNTSTGLLTESMFDGVFRTARRHLADSQLEPASRL